MDPTNSSVVTRRQLLTQAFAGFGSLALTGLLAEESLSATRSAARSPLAPRQPHFAPRAKRVIFLFMHGGPSHVDTFDYKPLLERDDGKLLPFAGARVQITPTDKLLASPWKFKQYGEGGLHISSLFPHLAECADDLCVIKSMCGTNIAHGPALMKLHTGTDSLLWPSMGSWLSYGLGTENQNLPSYITICPTSLGGGPNNWGSAFLPPIHHGVPLGTPGWPNTPAKQATFEYLKNQSASARQQRLELDLASKINRGHLEATGADAALEARIESFELAFRMQTTAPDILDISGESQATRRMYGLDDKVTENFGLECLLARRFAERGVRFIEVTHSNASPEQWDQHSKLREGHGRAALEVDKPIAGLLKDLKTRGLLDDTLVLWGGEFGRTPTGQGRDGRNHHPSGFTVWMAGGGVRGGMAYGATDEYGYYAVENRVTIPDLHATMLHLMGLDHERLTFTHAGRPFRLTDVSGNAIKDIIV